MSQSEEIIEPMEFMEMMLIEEQNQADADSDNEFVETEPIIITMTEDEQPDEQDDQADWSQEEESQAPDDEDVGDDIDDDESHGPPPDDSTTLEWIGPYASTGSMLGCPECGLAFKGHARLRRHLLLEHEDLTRPVSPPRIDNEDDADHEVNSPNDSDSDIDDDDAPPPPSSGLKCDHCSLRFPNSATLRRHLNGAHGINDTAINYFKCSFCPLIYKTKTNVKKHTEKMHPEQAHGQLNVLVSCPHCPSQYLSQAGLQRHLQAMHSNGNGGDAGESEEVAVAHQRWLSYLQCQYCSSRYKSELNLQRHVIAAHTFPDGSLRHDPINITTPTRNQDSPTHANYFVCQLCSAPYISEVGLRKHQRSVHDMVDASFPKQCPLCTSVHKTQISLRWHLEAFHDKVDSDFPSVVPNMTMRSTELFDCSQCPARFRGTGTLQRHVRLAHGSSTDEGGPSLSQPRVHCDHCSSNFAKPQQLLHHLKTKHRRTVESLAYCFQCSLCPLNYTRRGILERHMTECHPLPDRPVDQGVSFIQCDLCPLRFATDRKLNYMMHVKTRHRSNRFQAELKRKERKERPTYNCKVCSWTFPTYLSLQRHLKTKHRNIEYEVDYFECQHCPMRYATKNQCQVHMTQKHGPDAPPLDQQQVEFIQCEFCPLRYTTDKHRLRHMQAKHSGLMPMKQCDNCGRRFKKIALFEYHVRRCTEKSSADKFGESSSMADHAQSPSEDNNDNFSKSADKDNVQDSEGYTESGNPQDQGTRRSSNGPNSHSRTPGLLKTRMRGIGKQRGCSECGLAFPAFGMQFRQHQWKEHGIGAPVRSKRALAKEEAADGVSGCDEEVEDTVEFPACLPLRRPSKPPQLLQCEHCPTNAFIRPMRRHMTTAHPEHLAAFNLAHPVTPHRPFITCPLCPSSFQFRIKLTAHLKHCHSSYYRENICRYDCDFCDLKFGKPKTKETHMLVCPKRVRKRSNKRSSIPSDESENKSEITQSESESAGSFSNDASKCELPELASPIDSGATASKQEPADAAFKIQALADSEIAITMKPDEAVTAKDPEVELASANQVVKTEPAAENSTTNQEPLVKPIAETYEDVKLASNNHVGKTEPATTNQEQIVTPVTETETTVGQEGSPRPVPNGDSLQSGSSEGDCGSLQDGYSTINDNEQ